MKNAMKVSLVIALFCSAAFAEGDMGAGGKTCPPGQTTCLFNPINPTDEQTTKVDSSETESPNTTLEDFLAYFGISFN